MNMLSTVLHYAKDNKMIGTDDFPKFPTIKTPKKDRWWIDGNAQKKIAELMPMRTRWTSRTMTELMGTAGLDAATADRTAPRSATTGTMSPETAAKTTARSRAMRPLIATSQTPAPQIHAIPAEPARSVRTCRCRTSPPVAA
jgi:hypothetical protein